MNFEILFSPEPLEENLTSTPILASEELLLRRKDEYFAKSDTACRRIMSTRGINMLGNKTNNNIATWK